MVEFYCLFKQIQMSGFILTETDQFKVAYNNCFSLSFQLQFAQNTAWRQEDNRLCTYAVTVACCVVHLTKDWKYRSGKNICAMADFQQLRKQTYFLVSFLISRSSSSLSFCTKLSKTGISSFIYWATWKKKHFNIVSTWHKFTFFKQLIYDLKSLTTEMACRLACVQEQPVFLIKTFFWVPGKGKHISVYITYSVEHMETCGATTVKMWFYVICDFLSQVGLSDEDFGDFLAGSVKNTRHQWVFIVPQSGSLCQVTEGESE